MSIEAWHISCRYAESSALGQNAQGYLMEVNVMKPRHINRGTRTVTLGALCEALADGALPSEVEDGCYKIRRDDFRRFTEPPMIAQIIDYTEKLKSKRVPAAS